MYEKFLKQITDFIFIDQEPQKADIIFIPGNGFPNPSERAAELYREGFAKKLLPSGHYAWLFCRSFAKTRTVSGKV